MAAGDRKLECELTVKGGQVVWDQNGIVPSRWNELQSPSREAPRPSK